MRSLPELLYNFHWIVPHEAGRSAQAYAGFLGPFLGGRNIRAVINLRGPNPDWRWWRNERRICAARGIVHLDAMLSSKHLPSREMVLRLLDAFDTVPRPLLLKCSGGQDRTSFAAALYLLHRGGWKARPAAEAQFARWPYLHRPKPHQRWLKLFVAYAEEAADGATLRDWIASDYRSERFAAWLQAHGWADTHRDLYREPG